MQHTLRGVPEAIDKAIRECARREGKSLNEVSIRALAEGLGLGKGQVPLRDLSDVAGAWVRDAATEAAIAAQDEIDEALWK